MFGGLSGYQPGRDSLGKMKGKAETTRSELWACFRTVSVVCFFAAEPQRQRHVCTLHRNIVSVHYSCFCGGGATFRLAQSRFFCLFLFKKKLLRGRLVSWLRRQTTHNTKRLVVREPVQILLLLLLFGNLAGPGRSGPSHAKTTEISSAAGQRSELLTSWM